MSIKEILINEYSCDDPYGESCDGCCDNCKKILESDLNAFEQEIRAAVIDECIDKINKKYNNRTGIVNSDNIFDKNY